MWTKETIGKDHWLFLYLILGGAGVLVLAILALVLRWRRSHCSTRDSWHVFEKAMLASSRLLVPICVFACALACWFFASEHVYECGDPVLKLTLGYLNDGALQDSALGWKASTLVFLYSVLSGYLVQSFRTHMKTFYPELEHTGINAEPDTTFCTKVMPQAKQAAGFVLYCLLVAACCFVPFLNVVADYVPAQESAVQSWIRPSLSLIMCIKYSAGILLSIISNLLVPPAARKMAGSGKAAVRWMIFGRLVINQLSTAVFTVLLDQNCLAGWLHFISADCRRVDAFKVSGTIEVGPGEDGEFVLPLQITSHADICGTGMFRGGRCLQALISQISKLLISKLIFTAFAAPLIYLAICLPSVQIFRQWILSRLQGAVQSLGRWLSSRVRCCVRTCCPFLSSPVQKVPAVDSEGSQRAAVSQTASPDTEFTTHVSPGKIVELDTELISLIMLLEMCIVYVKVFVLSECAKKTMCYPIIT